ncbi:MAG: DUF2269 domain-containing protein [Saccharospirillaceae bacterium]|nr:DUF2269 domain-containing protein [Pseudomonadales bacterium]NRB79321.1 DUF2269 domain-containing protein [Saccharospirillaceae bacterium]
MDSYYLIIKLLHILSAIVVMGTGAGIAFFMLMAVMSKNNTVIKSITNMVVLADWFFTFPFALIQLLTGIWLMNYVGYSFQSPWFKVVGFFYIFLMFAWFIVVWIQYRLKSLSQQQNFDVLTNLPFQRLFRYWFVLGVLGFTCIMIVFYYMVVKPARFF